MHQINFLTRRVHTIHFHRLISSIPIFLISLFNVSRSRQYGSEILHAPLIPLFDSIYIILRDVCFPLLVDLILIGHWGVPIFSDTCKGRRLCCVPENKNIIYDTMMIQKNQYFLYFIFFSCKTYQPNMAFQLPWGNQTSLILELCQFSVSWDFVSQQQFSVSVHIESPLPQECCTLETVFRSLAVKSTVCYV